MKEELSCILKTNRQASLKGQSPHSITADINSIRQHYCPHSITADIHCKHNRKIVSRRVGWGGCKWPARHSIIEQTQADFIAWQRVVCGR